MSTDLIVTDAQKLDPGSGYVHLYELQITEDPDTWIYFANEYYDAAAGTKIEFRERETPENTNEYDVIPSVMEDVETAMDGPLPRPTVTIANVLRTLDATSFSGAIYLANSSSAIPYDALTGLKFVRRTTLKKYLYNVDTSNPPVEYPPEVYYIDRILEENNKTVTFELVSPFDLVGVTLPRRNVISVGCPWEYQGAGDHKLEYEKKGGCSWNQESKVTIEGTEYTFYVNQDDEYVLDLTTSNFILWASPPSVDKDDYYYTTGTTVTRIENDGSLTTSVAVNDYWQATTDQPSSPEAPADGNSNWRRVRICADYDTMTQYSVYLEDKYNDYVYHDVLETVKEVGGVSVTRLWKAVYRTQDAGEHDSEPQFSRYWQRGDICQKRLDSCAARFGAKGGAVSGNFATPPGTPGNYPIIDKDEFVVLPFGGFPTSRSFE